MRKQRIMWVRIVSRQITSLLLDRIRPLLPFFRTVPMLAVKHLPLLAQRARQRLGAIDIVGALIGLADRVETGIAWLVRLTRALSRHRSLGLTGGLLWRGVAALTGIGLTAALVTSLSADDSQAHLAGLTIQPAQELRPVRDVRQEPRHLPRNLSAGGENWVKIARPVAMFGLESPELERQPATYEARQAQDGSQREDVMAFGAFTEPKPHLLLRLLVERRSDELSQPFVIALVREAAARGMSVQRSGTPSSIETRFGPVETADATLSDGGASRSCIVFRKGSSDLPLSLNGWWCGAADRPADRQQLVCLIDRLDLLNAGDDRALRSAFARTELNRQPACAPQRLSATGRKASWLDVDGHPPALKTAASRR